MILPQKHIPIERTMIGNGAIIIKLLKKEMFSDDLWDKYKNYMLKQQIKENSSIDDFILTLDFLYSIKAININKGGKITRETTKTLCE
jgi:hypothetical protein